MSYLYDLFVFNVIVYILRKFPMAQAVDNKQSQGSEVTMTITHCGRSKKVISLWRMVKEAIFHLAGLAIRSSAVKSLDWNI